MCKHGSLNVQDASKAFDFVGEIENEKNPKRKGHIEMFRHGNTSLISSYSAGIAPPFL